MSDTKISAFTPATPATGGVQAGVQAGINVIFTQTAAGAAINEAADFAAQRTAMGIATIGNTGALTDGTGTLLVAHGGTGAVTLTGYLIGNGTGAITASATIPTTGLSGVLQAAQMPALTGDVTTVAGALATTISIGAVTDTKASLANKPSVGMVSVINLTLSGEQTIDGSLTSGSIVLLTAQTAGAENGYWMTAAGAWTRPTWYPAGGTTQAFQFISNNVRLGTVYAGSLWRMTTSGAITIDSTATVWAVVPRALNASTVAGTISDALLSANVSLLNAAQTMTAAKIFSTNGAASTPPLSLTGSWFTGGSATTTKPQALIEASGATSTGWSTAGTGLGVNAANAFVGLLEDLQLNGVSKYSVDYTGKLTFAGNLINSYTSIVSVSAALLNGVWFSGGSATTTKPHFLIETSGATSTGWNTAGTGLAVNAASGFTGNLFDLQLNGVSGFKVDSTGKTTIAGQFVAALNGSGNVPGAYISGTWHSSGTGTSTKPQLWVESSGAASSNAWNTAGTGIGVNAISGFSAGNLIDLQVNAVSRFSVAGSGLVTGGTVTRIALAYTGAASTSALTASGAWFSGGTATTTKPQLLVEASTATSTGWNTGGTGIGVNAISGFNGNLLDLQRNGATQASFNQNGSLTLSTGVFKVATTGIVSFPAIWTSGTWITGGSSTTNKPHWLIEAGAATSTNWQTTGTGLGINAASGFVGYLVDMQLNGVARFSIDYTGSMILADSANITVNATTGTKIGTATSQKLGLWNATPVIQPAGANQAALTDSTTGTPGFTLNDVGVVFSQSAINNNFASLNRQVDAFRTALVAAGMIKGAA